jgi:hypothetical protein
MQDRFHFLQGLLRTYKVYADNREQPELIFNCRNA